MCVKEILSIWIIQPSEKRLSKDTADFLLKNMHYGRHLFISELDTARLKSGICSLGWMAKNMTKLGYTHTLPHLRDNYSENWVKKFAMGYFKIEESPQLGLL